MYHRINICVYLTRTTTASPECDMGIYGHPLLMEIPALNVRVVNVLALAHGCRGRTLQTALASVAAITPDIRLIFVKRLTSGDLDIWPSELESGARTIVLPQGTFKPIVLFYVL